MAATPASPDGPWNPGLSSQLTPELWRQCTIFRPENVLTSYEQAVELRDATGLPLPQLVVWRPQRLVLHEVLARVIADYEVPDPEGAAVRSLGINFRKMTRAIQKRLAPNAGVLVGDYQVARDAIARIVTDELAAAFGRAPAVQPTASPRQKWGWLRRTRAPAAIDESPLREDRLIDIWQARARTDSVAFAAYGALIRVVSAVRSQHGALWGSPEVLGPLITGLACNAYGAEVIADRAGPLIAEAAAAEGFRPLPTQDRSIAFSTKGASAAGKSTMRPLLRSLAARLGASWGDFALISPDIFRRDLLDIDSLGSQYKYFGTFTSHELEVVDRKLDRHLARRTVAGTTPHVLIDRFRFDSFAPNSEEQRQLFARLGTHRLVYYVFMITPPELTVDRAWKRGLELGRYKPLDDLLAHNVEAYAGMQAFFLARALHPDSGNQHYEFVDNDVPKGEVPLTVAFGSRGEFNILDARRLLDMVRYCRINVDARGPEELYADAQALAVQDNLGFLATCVRAFPVLNVAHRVTGRLYVRFERGRLAWSDPDAVDALADAQTREALRELAPSLERAAGQAPRYLDGSGSVTLGRWGPG